GTVTGGRRSGNCSRQQVRRDPHCSPPPGMGNTRAVDEAPPTIDALTNEIREVALQVHQAQAHLDDREVLATAHAGVDRLSRRYRELLQSLSASDQLQAERLLGRRVVDLRRLAELLPKVPTSTRES